MRTGRLALRQFPEARLLSLHLVQRQASKDEEFTEMFLLHFLKEGKADSVSMALYLFKDQTGTAPEDIAMIFEDKPASDYDGHFIYAQIPPPVRWVRLGGD